MIGAVVFARMESTRLPSKVIMQVQGKPILQHVIERVAKSHHVEKIVLATTMNSADDVLEELGQKLNVGVFRGSERDVLDRCYQVSTMFSLDPIVRVTADDPFKDPDIIDRAIEVYIGSGRKYDLVCNTLKPTFPEGLDVEVMSFKALERTWTGATKSSEREHITLHMFNNPEKFRILNIENNEDLSAIRLTLDAKEDFELVKILYDMLYPLRNDFSWTDVVSYLKSKPELLEINKNVKKSGRYQNNG